MDTIASGKRLTLHFGVIVQPYRSPGKKTASVSTGDVAQWLEDKYGIMEAFYRVHENDVVSSIEKSLGGALENLIMGAPAGDPFGSAMGEIETAFKFFIASKEVETVGLPGVPTKAALMGVNHRLKHPYANKNPRRPSFRDTGLYMDSFKSWID